MPFEVKLTVMADASDLGSGAVVLQNDQPVAYQSLKFSKAELNYPVQDKELLALVRALKEWRPYLEGPRPVTLLTDHHPLTYLQTQSALSRRQARVLQYLSRYNFEIKYQRGVDNVVADALSRHPGIVTVMVTTRSQAARLSTTGFQPGEKGHIIHEMFNGHQQKRPRRKGDRGRRVVTPVTGTEERGKVRTKMTSIMEALQSAYQADPLWQDTAYTKGLQQDESGLWWFHNKIAVPQNHEVRTRIMQALHDSPWAAHRGVARTIELVRRQFWWAGLAKDVEQYVETCDACQRNKACNQAKAGLLHPLSVPKYRWQSVSMDLIVKLPRTNKGHDTILVFVDRLTKYAHFTATTESLQAADFATLFIINVVANHGMPQTLISDRGTVWNSEFSRALLDDYGVDLKLSSPYHPETDGQTERMNKLPEDMLRHYVSPTQKEWDEWLPLVQFSANNSWQESIQSTPFFLNTGENPVVPSMASIRRNTSVPGAKQLAKQIRSALQKARECMHAAQQRQKVYADQHRRDVTYNPGELVLLQAKNFRFAAKGAKKLFPKFIVPFPVASMVGTSAVELQLPTGGNWNRLHNVYHISLLRRYKPRPGDSIQPPPIEIGGMRMTLPSLRLTTLSITG